MPLRTLSVIFLVLFSMLSFPGPVSAVRLTKATDPNHTSSQARFTMDFRDVDIRVVAKFISDITGKNFIFDKKVRDKVTVFSPTEVTAEEAYRLFETVLKIHGFTTVPSRGVIKIMPSREARTADIETRPQPPAKERAEDDRVVTQLIRLQHADANEMRTLLQPLIAKTGLLMAYDSGNTLIVTDYASNIDRLVKILAAVDVEDEVTKLSVIEVKNASAKEVARELQEILKSTKPRGKSPTGGSGMDYTVVPDERTNNLIVMARPSETRTIRDIVTRLDVITPRGSDRVHVYFLRHAVAEDLAATLNDLTGKEASAGAAGQGKAAAGATRLMLQEPVFITAEKSTNALIVRAERQDYLVLKDIIQKLDIQRSQVLVEGVVMEMSASKANALGAEWRILNLDGDSGNSVFGGTGMSSDSLINTMSQNPFAGPSGLVLGAAEGTVTWGGTTLLNIGALIQALEGDSDVNILSTPHLLTMDNEEARIVVGEERPFLKESLTTATSAASASITNTYEYKDLGLTLKITPHITQGDYIKLKIYQELKSYVDESEVGAITSTKREAETTVQVRDRETVVIGGMISNEQRNTRTSVPCLGNIPGAGWAFKSRSQQDDKLNLLILIKPSIVRTGDTLKDLTEKKRQEMECISDDTIQGPGEGYPRTGPRILGDPENKRNRDIKMRRQRNPKSEMDEETGTFVDPEPEDEVFSIDQGGM